MKWYRISKIDISQYEQTGPQSGSNPGGFFGKDDSKWYAKQMHEPRARNELLASKLYELAGISVPNVEMAEIWGGHGLASQIIEGLESRQDLLTDGELPPGVAEGFAADAWLANWDVVGLEYDNLLIGPQGNAHRIDTGGALDYRAMGSLKGDAFGEDPSEMETMRDPNIESGKVFSRLTSDQIRSSISNVMSISDEDIEKTVMEYGYGDDQSKTNLSNKLIARKNNLVNYIPKEMDTE